MTQAIFLEGFSSSRHCTISNHLHGEAIIHNNYANSTWKLAAHCLFLRRRISRALKTFKIRDLSAVGVQRFFHSGIENAKDWLNNLQQFRSRLYKYLHMLQVVHFTYASKNRKKFIAWSLTREATFELKVDENVWVDSWTRCSLFVKAAPTFLRVCFKWSFALSLLISSWWHFLARDD